MNVSDVATDQARRRPAKLAVACDDQELSYAQLAERVVRLANGFAALGIERGERVGVLLPNCAEHVEVMLALARLGAVWVPVNYRLAPQEMAFILEDSGTTALVFHRDLDELADELRRAVGLPDGRLVTVGGTPALGHGHERLIAAARAGGGQAAEADDVFAIMYTSGTTGRPKGVVLTHRQFLIGTRLFAHAIAARHSDRKLQALPQFHAGGAIYQLAYLMAGATVVVLPRFDPLLLHDTVRKREVTVCGLVPTMLHELLEGGVLATDMPSLRRFMYGGAPIAAPQLVAAMERFPLELLQTYGQTEAGVIVTILDSQSHARAREGGDPELLASCGRPIDGYEVELVPDEPGAPVGELHVRSASLMREYWRRPDATKDAIVDGWLRTGDLARQDEDGYLYLVDRRSSMIISGGENIYPSEVENVLAAHPNVADVSVIGMPDDKWGETVAACIVARTAPAPDAAEIRSYCAGRIAGFKIPQLVYEVDAIPRNASGKVIRHRLTEQL